MQGEGVFSGTQSNGVAEPGVKPARSGPHGPRGDDASQLLVALGEGRRCETVTTGLGTDSEIPGPGLS